MYDTIQQVINDSVNAAGYGNLTRQYGSVIEKVAADVATHISKCSEDLIGKADEYGIDEQVVREALIEVGLAVEREPEVAASMGDAGVDARLTAIEQTLARLSGIAERAERSGLLR